MKREATEEKLEKAKNTNLVYLASPYTNPDDAIKEKNYEMVSEIAAVLTAEGHVVFSPISYGHNLIKFKDMPGDWAFWFNFCVTFLLKCDKLIVCKMPGWEHSVGVQEEIEIASKHCIPIEFIDVKMSTYDK
jgi:hypothetical protein